MNKIILGVLMLLALAAHAGEKKPAAAKEVTMAGHEVNGVDRGKLNLVDDTVDTFSTMKQADKTRSDWEKRVSDTAEEMAWW